MNLDQTQAGLIRMTDDEFVKLTSFVKKKYGIDLTKKRTEIGRAHV